MGTKIYYPYIKPFGVPIVSLDRIKLAGFDGIEIHLASYRDTSQIARTIAEAVERNLKVSIHQGWSLSENPTHGINRWLNRFGYLPPDGYTLAKHIPPGNFPTVIYADRWREADTHRNWYLQTCSVFGPDLKFKLTFDEFVPIVKRHKRGVVFDTQHVLEWMLDLSGVEHLSTDRQELLGLLIRAWNQLGFAVREIHFNDCNPRLGHTKGRNVFPGEGVLPLREFVRIVKESRWDGVVVPEVPPQRLLFGGVEELRARVANFWGC